MVAAAGLVVLTAVVPLAAGESSTYVTSAFVGFCGTHTVCHEAGLGLVTFEVPGDAEVVDLSIEDALDDMGYDQVAKYQFYTQDQVSILDAPVPFCDSTTGAAVPEDAATLWVNVKLGDQFILDVCEGSTASSAGEVVAGFR